MGKKFDENKLMYSRFIYFKRFYPNRNEDG